MADMFDELVVVMRRRQAGMAGNVRVHTPTLAEPLYVLVIDELSALTSYLPDNDLKNRMLQSMGLVLSQGAGLGVEVVGASQDPRKETLALRDLYPTRVALRVNEPGHVDLILGGGARARGALADQIPNDPQHQGTGYVEVAGFPEPVRVRFSYLSDDEIREMAAAYPAPPELLLAVPVPVAAIVSGPRSRGGRRSKAGGEGPLLPAGLLDALHRTNNDTTNDNDGGGEETRT
jgi:S-DNA-T family DNA segregation ATPase FtsK/SpoIIIE